MRYSGLAGRIQQDLADEVYELEMERDSLVDRVMELECTVDQLERDWEKARDA